MSRKFAVVFEASADFQIATDLADRVLCEAIVWLDEDTVVDQRKWLNNSPEGHLLTWTNIDDSARKADVKAHGHFDGEPAEPDAIAARRAIRYLRFAFDDLDAILLIRDQDKVPERKKGLEQARSENHHGLPIVIGLAVVEREAWVLSGFAPANEDETTLLVKERENLGFQPHEQSHLLTACTNDQAKRSPKRVLQALTAGDPTRQQICWQTTALTTLRERGTENGLTSYLDEVLQKLAPLLGHPDSDSGVC